MNGPGRPVLWIDPGKMTGLAYWAPWHQEWVVGIEEYDFMQAADRIGAHCAAHRRWLLIGWEHFVITPKTPPDDAHHAIEMIGVARLYAQLHGCQILPVAMPDERLTVSRKMLEAVRWWLPGKDDAQSAAQHLLAWMLRQDCVPNEVMTSIRSTIQE